MDGVALGASQPTSSGSRVERFLWRLRNYDLTPRQVTLIYLALGFAALYVSDVLLPEVLTDPLLSQAQAVKGGAEVLLTGGLIYALTWGSRAPLKQLNEELEASRRELSVLHRVLRHNLRNNLTIVIGYAELLETQADAAHLEKYCQAIKSTCEEFDASIEKTKLLSDLHANGQDTTQLDLTVVLDRIQQELANEHPNASITVEYPESPDVVAHKHVDFVLQELVGNAIIHNPAPEPTVDVIADQPPDDSHRLRIRIEDDGPGISEHEVAALRRQEEAPLLHGSSVGLWVAKWIVQQSDGTFEIENTESGCRVTVTLFTPLSPPFDVDVSQLTDAIE